ncbi:hypothetical protein TSMEX_001885 [Taenia solium]|eukprot:TsM_001046000 transcript=TsM_001046000 gene=TsM_001046000
MDVGGPQLPTLFQFSHRVTDVVNKESFQRAVFWRYATEVGATSIQDALKAAYANQLLPPLNGSLCRSQSANPIIEQQTPAMVALSPLPLDYLPHSAVDEAKLELDAQAEGGEHSVPITTATVDSNRSSATSPSPPLFPLSSPSSTSAVLRRSTRSRLSNSWSTSLGHSPGRLSASSSSREGCECFSLLNTLARGTFNM